MATGDGSRPDWLRRSSVVVILPAMLVAVEVASIRTDVKVLLFPPLAAIGYRIFRRPESDATRPRSVVLGPVLGSLIGWGLAAAGGLQPWTVAVAVLAGVLVIEVLSAHAPPILAITLLALFVGQPGGRYPLAVLASTSLLYGTFRAWLWATRRWRLSQRRSTGDAAAREGDVTRTWLDHDPPDGDGDSSARWAE